jgi:mono/diheme cytochrome c family protein
MTRLRGYRLMAWALVVLIPACSSPREADRTQPAVVATNPDRNPVPETIPPPREVVRAAPEPMEGAVAEGRQLFLKLQCVNCHTAKPDARAPVLEGLYGTRVPLKGGGVEVADEAYIRESILKPREKVVEGWEPIMPSYEGKVTAEELNSLVQFVRSLKRGSQPAKGEPFPPPVGAPKDPPGK